MIHLKKFNENKDNNELTIYNIMLYMINIVDEYNVEFYNVNSYVTYAKDVKEDTKFKFSENIYTKKKSNFSIKINGDMDYETYLSLGDEMLQIIKLLKENDWLLTDLSSNKRAGYPNELVFSSLNFKFSKPDETIIPSKSLEKTISTENISNILYNYGLDVSQKYISYHDNYDSENEDEHNEWIDIEDYDTDKDSFDLQEAIDNACEVLGGYYWEYLNGKNGIRIFFGNNK